MSKSFIWMKFIKSSTAINSTNSIETELFKKVKYYIKEGFIFDTEPSFDIKNAILEALIAEENFFNISQLSMFLSKNKQYFSKEDFLQYFDKKYNFNRENIDYCTENGTTLSNLLFFFNPEDITKLNLKNKKILLLLTKFENLSLQDEKDIEIFDNHFLYKELADIYIPNSTPMERLEFYFKMERDKNNILINDLDIYDKLQRRYNNSLRIFKRTFSMCKLEDFNFNLLQRKRAENIGLLNKDDLYLKFIDKYIDLFKTNKIKSDNILEFEYFLKEILNMKKIIELIDSSKSVENLILGLDIDIKIKIKIFKEYLKVTKSIHINKKIIILFPDLFNANDIHITNFIKEIDNAIKEDRYEYNYLLTYQEVLNKLIDFNIISPTISIMEDFKKYLENKKSSNVRKIKEKIIETAEDIYTYISEEIYVNKKYTINDELNEKLKSLNSMYITNTKEEYDLLINNIDDIDNVYLFLKNILYDVIEEYQFEIWLNRLFFDEISKQEKAYLINLAITGINFESVEYLYDLLKRFNKYSQVKIIYNILSFFIKNLDDETKLKIIQINNIENSLNNEIIEALVSHMNNNNLQLEYKIKYNNISKDLEMTNITEKEWQIIIDNKFTLNDIDLNSTISFFEYFLKSQDKSKFKFVMSNIIFNFSQYKNKDILDYVLNNNLEIDILKAFPDLEDMKWLSLITDFNKIEYLYKNNLIKTETFLKIFNAKNECNNIEVDKSLFMKALNEEPIFDSIKWLLFIKKDFDVKDIYSSKLLSQVLAIISNNSYQNLENILKENPNGFSLKYINKEALSDLDIIQEHLNVSNQYYRYVNLLLKDLICIEPNLYLNDNQFYTNTKEKYFSKDIIRSHRFLFLLLDEEFEYKEIKCIFQELEPNVENILEQILLKEDYVKLMLFIKAFNDNIFDLNTYNRLLAK